MELKKDLLLLLKKGYVSAETKNIKETTYFILKVFGFMIFLKLIALAIAQGLVTLDFYENPINIGLNHIKDFSFIKRYLIIAVYAPIVEELAFRIGLKFSLKNITLATFALIVSLLRILVKLEWSIALLLATLAATIIYFTLKRKSLFNYFNNLWTKNKLLLFYSSLLIFSFLHLTNYKITLELILFSPIIILPRIIGGLMLSYVRFKTGIITAIGLHIINNSLPVLILLLKP